MVSRPRALVLALACLLLGCAPYRPDGYAPQYLIEKEHPRKVRAVLDTGHRVVLEQPQVVGDSLVGNVEGARAAYALTDVRQLEVRRDESIWLVIAIPALFYLGLIFSVGAVSS